MTAAMTNEAEPEIICERRGEAGFVVLNRPRALNALTLTMVRGLAEALKAWEHDPAVTRIVLTGAGDRAFCAGGDIRRLYDLGKAGHAEEAMTFWREEYALNAYIKRYPKPYISLIDGIVMGGGVGVSLHGAHRVAGSRYLFAMPEVGIGFFPDVGATYALPRLPGATGTWLAVTGERVKVADAVQLGLATAHVPSEAMSGLMQALIDGEIVEEAIEVRRADPGPAPVEAERALIDACFSRATLFDAMDALKSHAADGSAFAAATLQTIATKSPTSLLLAFEQMKRGRDMTFEQAVITELRIVSRVVAGHDFYEGVRAVLIDKDNAPRWSPATLDGVAKTVIDGHFAPIRQELAL